MEAFILHLRKLVRINRQILNELHKDEASITSIRSAFDEREVHTQKMGELIAGIDNNHMSDKESTTIQALFEKFEKQAKKIQNALDYIVKSSRNHLGDAIKRRKAEEGYRSLK